jgi:hypothetical protein
VLNLYSGFYDVDLNRHPFPCNSTQELDIGVFARNVKLGGFRFRFLWHEPEPASFLQNWHKNRNYGISLLLKLESKVKPSKESKEHGFRFFAHVFLDASWTFLFGKVGK